MMMMMMTMMMTMMMMMMIIISTEPAAEECVGRLAEPAFPSNSDLTEVDRNAGSAGRPTHAYGIKNPFSLMVYPCRGKEAWGRARARDHDQIKPGTLNRLPITSNTNPLCL
eukprot:2511589-Rhodomonas_salina.1